MSLLGFDAIGRQPLGRVPDQGTVSIALTARCSSQTRSFANRSVGIPLQATSKTTSNARSAQTNSISGAGRISGKSGGRMPGGLGIAGRVGVHGSVKATAGFAITGTIKGATTAAALPHLEIKVTPPRRALLLNSTSVTASYWKGHS